MSFKNLGRIFSHRNDVYAVTPNAANVIDDRFLLTTKEVVPEDARKNVGRGHAAHREMITA